MKTLRPTFQLTIGLPGRSNAIAIASRLGLDPEIVAAAKSEVHPDDLRTDKLLDDIRKERNRSSRERDKAIKARQKTDEFNRELEKRLEASRTNAARCWPKRVPKANWKSRCSSATSIR